MVTRRTEIQAIDGRADGNLASRTGWWKRNLKEPSCSWTRELVVTVMVFAVPTEGARL